MIIQERRMRSIFFLIVCCCAISLGMVSCYPTNSGRWNKFTVKYKQIFFLFSRKNKLFISFIIVCCSMMYGIVICTKLIQADGVKSHFNMLYFDQKKEHNAFLLDCICCCAMTHGIATWLASRLLYDAGKDVRLSHLFNASLLRRERPVDFQPHHQ